MSEAVLPVCQQECILSASELSSAGYRFRESTTCSNAHACENDPTQMCLSANQDCYFHCLDQYVVFEREVREYHFFIIHLLITLERRSARMPILSLAHDVSLESLAMHT